MVQTAVAAVCCVLLLQEAVQTLSRTAVSTARVCVTIRNTPPGSCRSAPERATNAVRTLEVSPVHLDVCVTPSYSAFLACFINFQLIIGLSRLSC